MEDQKPDGQGGPLDQATLLQIIATGTQAQNQTMLAVQVSGVATMPRVMGGGAGPAVGAACTRRTRPPDLSAEAHESSSKAWPNGATALLQALPAAFKIGVNHSNARVRRSWWRR